MEINSVALKIDAAHVVRSLRDAAEKMGDAGGELVLDFSAVGRIDTATVGAIEKLAGVAGEKAVKVVLQGVNVDVYKVLKLVRLAPRFSFAT